MRHDEGADRQPDLQRDGEGRQEDAGARPVREDRADVHNELGVDDEGRERQVEDRLRESGARVAPLDGSACAARHSLAPLASAGDGAARPRMASM